MKPVSKKAKPITKKAKPINKKIGKEPKPVKER